MQKKQTKYLAAITARIMKCNQDFQELQSFPDKLNKLLLTTIRSSYKKYSNNLNQRVLRYASQDMFGNKAFRHFFLIEKWNPGLGGKLAH